MCISDIGKQYLLNMYIELIQDLLNRYVAKFWNQIIDPKSEVGRTRK